MELRLAFNLKKEKPAWKKLYVLNESMLISVED